MLRRREAKPRAIWTRFRKRVLRALGNHDSWQVWNYRQYAEKNLETFGEMNGFWRTHHMFCAALQLCYGQKLEHIPAYLVQAIKATHQMALDKGSWDNAARLMPFPDFAERAFWRGQLRVVRHSEQEEGAAPAPNPKGNAAGKCHSFLVDIRQDIASLLFAAFSNCRGTALGRFLTFLGNSSLHSSVCIEGSAAPSGRSSRASLLPTHWPAQIPGCEGSSGPRQPARAQRCLAFG